MLRDDIALYTELTGKDGLHTPIGIIGSYLDGYEKGKSERKKGRWIEDEEQTHVEICYHCSECGYGAWGSYEKTDFCGGCGADMRGDQDGNQS